VRREETAGSGGCAQSGTRQSILGSTPETWACKPAAALQACMIEMESGTEAVVLETEVARLAFEDFYASEFDRVFDTAYAFCRDRDAAAEATQEAFARAFARWRRLSRKEWAGAWVTTTALNVLRRSFRTRNSSHPEHEMMGSDPANRVDLLRALQSLPLRQRQAATLYYVADLPVSAVADAMQLSEGAVKAHLSRARVHLRRSLEERHD